MKEFEFCFFDSNTDLSGYNCNCNPHQFSANSVYMTAMHNLASEMITIAETLLKTALSYFLGECRFAHAKYYFHMYNKQTRQFLCS